MSVDNPEQILGKARWGDYQKADGTWGRGISNAEDVLVALEVYYKAQASKDIHEIIGKDEDASDFCHNFYRTMVRNNVRLEQRKTAASKGYRVED